MKVRRSVTSLTRSLAFKIWQCLREIEILILFTEHDLQPKSIGPVRGGNFSWRLNRSLKDLTEREHKAGWGSKAMTEQRHDVSSMKRSNGIHPNVKGR